MRRHGKLAARGPLVLLRSSALLAIMFLLAFIPALASDKKADPATENATQKTKTAPKRHRPIKQFEVFAPYWSTEPGWDTELTLRNMLSGSEITVTPVLRLASGTEVPLSAVTLKADEARTVGLSDALASAAPHLLQATDSFGSVVFRYQALAEGNLFAGVTLRLSNNSGALHFDASRKDTKSQVEGYEGIWWLPEPTTTAYLVVSNIVAKPLQGTVELLDTNGTSQAVPLALAAGETLRLNIREIIEAAKFAGQIGGVRVVFATKHAGALVAHFEYDESAHFAAAMQLVPHVRSDAGDEPITLRAPSVALRSPDPALGFPADTMLQSKLFLRNTTVKPIPVQLVVDWRTASAWGRKQIPPLALSPNQTTLFSLSDLQEKDEISKEANWAAIAVSYTGADGDIVPIALSHAEKEQSLTQSLFSNGLIQWAKGGAWRADAAHNSLITIGNGGDSPTRAQLVLSYAAGTKRYELPPKQLQPGEAMTIDVGKLIRERATDANGTVLPEDMC